MNEIDYACGIDCPDHYNDEQMLNEFVVCEDCELLYLDSFLTETFGTK